MLLLCVTSCKNDDNVISPDPSGEQPTTPINFEVNFGNSVTAKFLGRIVDEQNEPLPGVTIRIGNTVTTTDLFGTFSMSSSEVFERFAYISAEKQGYITGSRALAPSTTSVNRVEIMLLKKEVIATVASGETAMVNLSNGTEVSFDGSYATQDGTPYNGAVEVVLKHLSPEDANMAAMMPGMLFAQNTSGSAVALETYGMIAVELLSNTGQELQLGEGSTAQITMPVPANSLNPPATIPLWHFDENVGYWIEEGQATLQGNMYVGEVSHFTFWNYDYPYPAINLCITLQDENGNALSYTAVELYSALLNATGTYGYTDNNGEECGLVPANEELTVTVPNPLCPEQQFTTTVGPFTADANVTLTVTNSQNSTTIQGNFVSCDGEVVTDGYIQLFINGNTEIIPVTDGTINYTISYCDTLTYSLKGVDVANNQITEVISGTLDGDTTIDLGTLSSCTGFEDTDGDGVFDILEDVNGDNDLSNDDTDQDGVPNYQDADDDGDGIDTADEDYDGDGDPTNEDSDGDQIPDYLDPQDVQVFIVETQGQGCGPVEFDLTFIASEFGNDLHTYEFYATQADAAAGNNPLSSPYSIPIADLFVDVYVIYVVATNNTTAQTATGEVYLFLANTDSDGDGLTECEETTGIDNPNTNQVPSGTSDPNDPSDPNIPELLMTFIASVDEGLGSATMQVFFNYASSVDTTIDITTTDGTATSPDDYVATVTTLTIPAGSVSLFFTIPIVDDLDVEPTEDFTVTATVTSGNTSNTTVQGTVAIYDNDSNGNFPQTGTLEACDDGSGTAIFDLTVMNNYYSLGLPAVISYHTTAADANANLNPIGNIPVSAANGDIFYVRIEHQGEVQVSTLEIIINPIPAAPAGLSLTQCDGNGDGIATFDLTQLNAQIIQTQTDVIVSYYETQADAINGTNPIASPYTNVANPMTLFYRVETLNGICFSTGTIDLIVDPGC
jgi:hypothetical protein